MRDEPNQDMIRGTALHAVLNDLYELPRSNRTPEAARTVFQQLWAKERVDTWSRSLFSDIAQEREWGIKALQLLENYFHLEDPTEHDPLWREKRLFVEFGEAVSQFHYDENWQTSHCMHVAALKLLSAHAWSLCHHWVQQQHM